VEGGIFARSSLIGKLEILDSEIKGSLLFRESVILTPAILDTIALSGELSFRQAAFSYFLLQFSKVGGVLDLTNSRAYCAYEIRTSEIGDLIAASVGFSRHSIPDDYSNTKVAPTIDWLSSVSWWSLLDDAKRKQTTEMTSAWACKYSRISPTGL